MHVVAKQRNPENQNRFGVLQDMGESSKVIDQPKEIAQGREPTKTKTKSPNGNLRQGRTGASHRTQYHGY